MTASLVLPGPDGTEVPCEPAAAARAIAPFVGSAAAGTQPVG